MKQFWCITALLCIAALLALSCESAVLPGQYGFQLPEIPATWTALLGRPRWRLEWVGRSGPVSVDVDDTEQAGAALSPEWPSAVLAWPFWPEKELPPGLFRPAGGIFPLDVRGGMLHLSWRAGAEALFYRELELASGGSGSRRPRYFDWPRFRTLLADEAPAAVREDPWLVNWRAAAESTVKSGFRKTLVVPAAWPAVTVTLPGEGPWMGPSPFADPRFWTAGSTVTVPSPEEGTVLVSPGGILRYSPGAVLWKPW